LYEAVKSNLAIGLWFLSIAPSEDDGFGVFADIYHTLGCIIAAWYDQQLTYGKDEKQWQ